VDAKAASQSCSFTVTVTVPQQISLTRFRGFGDSITAGEIVTEGFGGFKTLKVDRTLAYPKDLYDMLASRYTAQLSTLTVLNDGVSGEGTACGYARLTRQTAGTTCDPGLSVAINQYQVLLLMEGSNDIFSQESIAPAVNNIRQMVRFAKNNGVRVYLGTIPPQSTAIGSGPFCPARNGGLPYVPSYNSQLISLAFQEGVQLVDVYTALSTNLSLYIDCDGLHPTAAGYTRIAQEFYNSLQQTLEVKAPPVPTFPAPGIVQTLPRPAPRRK
jgi:lysophospholipase L1-like esterase